MCVGVDAKTVALSAGGFSGGSAEDVEVDDGNQGCGGGGVDEVFGVEQSSFGMGPAGQTLICDEHARVEVDD